MTNKVLPSFIPPQLAYTVSKAPSGEEWVHEIKYDGYRMLVRIGRQGDVTIFSRNGKNWTSHFPSVVRELCTLAVTDMWIDGEMVFLRDNGQPCFQSLQNSIEGRGDDSHVFYMVFDLLWLNGQDLRQYPLIERKRRLRRLLLEKKPATGNVRYCEHMVGKGPEFFEKVRVLDLEGIISKRADSSYHSCRSKAWVKIKCSKRGEFFVGGFTGAAKNSFRSLLLGKPFGVGKLEFLGKVGTGFPSVSVPIFRKLLDQLVVKIPPFQVVPKKYADRDDVRWVKPILLAEVQYTELTASGILRHPSFKGIKMVEG